jgi:hypothetical protein
MERLGSSAEGARLVMHVNDAVDEGLDLLLKDVVQKFDAFGLEASEYFESRARLLSVIVGFVVAMTLNVNAIALFDTFMRRPEVRNAVIERSDAVTGAYRQLQASVNTLEAAAPATQAGAATATGDAAVQRQSTMCELSSTLPPSRRTAQSQI